MMNMINTNEWEQKVCTNNIIKVNKWAGLIKLMKIKYGRNM